MFDVDDEEDGSICVFLEDLIDLNIVGFEGVSSGVPSDKFFFLADLHRGSLTLRIMANMDSWKALTPSVQATSEVHGSQVSSEEG